MAGGSLSGADAVFLGESGVYSANNLSGAGDFNGDGLADLLIAFEGYYAGGNLLLGTNQLEDRHLVTPDGRFATAECAMFASSAVSGAGDVNGDGFDDLIVGAYCDDGDVATGAAYLFLGASF